MHIDTMTPRERWLAVLQRKTPDRAPMDYWATPEATQKLLAHLGCSSADEMFKRLHIDAVASIGGRYVGPPIPSGENVFGVRHRTIEYETGSYAETDCHPLARFASVEEIEKEYRWPNPDWWDYSDIPHRIVGLHDRPIRGGGSEPFLVYATLRGLEQAMMDLALNPEIVHFCLDRLFDLAFEDTRRVYEQANGAVMMSYVAEDMGSQDSLLFSPRQINTFLVPRMKRMIDLAHSAGVYVFHHSDGAIRSILPAMVEAGIDILNPIQWRCKGMDRAELKQSFGSSVIFHGGVDNQYTLAMGTIDEVRKEVEDNFRLLGEGGGYIPAPCHNIQAVSPPENIVAMYETAYELGRG